MNPFTVFTWVDNSVARDAQILRNFS